MTCDGCHRIAENKLLGSGLTRPNDMGFVHVDFGIDTFVTEVTRATSDVFLPKRREVLRETIYCAGNSAMVVAGKNSTGRDANVPKRGTNGFPRGRFKPHESQNLSVESISRKTRQVMAGFFVDCLS